MSSSPPSAGDATPSPIEPDQLGRWASLACLLEATAPKVGNVHRGADFEDLTFYDFTVAAIAIAKPISGARQAGVGPTVRDAIRATRNVAGTNVNLGIALLLAPLAACDPRRPLDSAAVRQVLERLTPEDASLTYEAIRLARPGGIGEADAMDVHGPAPPSLLAAMQAAATRDLVAQQYATDFSYVLGPLAEWLESACAMWGWPRGIVHAQLQSLAEHPDSLIARKCGEKTARTASVRAAAVLAAGPPDSEPYEQALADLDFWMRSDGHRRNPGATADLIAGALFALLRDGRLALGRWRVEG